MLAVCLETDMKNQKGVSKLGRYREAKEKGRAFYGPAFLRSRPPYPGLILHSAASKKQHQKATHG